MKASTFFYFIGLVIMSCGIGIENLGTGLGILGVGLIAYAIAREITS